MYYFALLYVFSSSYGQHKLHRSSTHLNMTALFQTFHLAACRKLVSPHKSLIVERILEVRLPHVVVGSLHRRELGFLAKKSDIIQAFPESNGKPIYK